MSKMRNFVDRMLGKGPSEGKLIEFKLEEIDGERFNLDPEVANEVIQTIYDNVLKDRDNRWHLFYEGYFYSLLRVSPEFEAEVSRYLDFLGVSYRNRGEWIDSSDTVKAWQDDIFEPLFHLFSEIGRREYYDPEDQTKHYLVIDRVIHCFMNHQYYALRDYVERNWLDWEARLLAEQTLNRAVYMGKTEGIYEGYRIAAETAEEEEEA